MTDRKTYFATRELMSFWLNVLARQYTPGEDIVNGVWSGNRWLSDNTEIKYGYEHNPLCHIYETRDCEGCPIAENQIKCCGYLYGYNEECDEREENNCLDNWDASKSRNAAWAIIETLRQIIDRMEAEFAG